MVKNQDTRGRCQSPECQIHINNHENMEIEKSFAITNFPIIYYLISILFNLYIL